MGRLQAPCNRLRLRLLDNTTITITNTRFRLHCQIITITIMNGLPPIINILIFL